MSKKPRFDFYLVHMETGQRYPLVGEIVIGRTLGDVLFPEDQRLSNRHCRTARAPGGFTILDLESANGTVVDGHILDPKKVYALKPTRVIEIGQQRMRVEESYVKSRQRARRRKKGGFDLPSFLAIALIASATFLIANMYMSAKSTNTTVKLAPRFETPLELVEKEMRQAFAEYSKVGQNHTAGKVSDKELSQAIRARLIPRLIAARTKMEVLRPQTDWERKKIAANKSLLLALIGQVSAIASFTETRSRKSARDIEALSARVEEMNREVQRLDGLREPAGK